MKKIFFIYCKANLLALIAIISFLFLTCTKQKDNIENQAFNAPKVSYANYDVSVDQLKQFMLDSLHKTKFLGGRVYSKKDLLNSINSLSDADDSVYLLNVVDFPPQGGNTSSELAITSRNTPGVIFIVRPCRPCPGRLCCKTRVQVVASQ